MELDHVFILCEPDAPGAESLRRLGVREGSPNTHPGQGTACRRFFFANAYLELIWVGDDAEAGSEPIDVADGTPLAEPAVFHMAVQRSRGRSGEQPLDHELPLRTVSRVSIEGPIPSERSEAGRALEATGAFAFVEAPAYLLTLDFSAAPGAVADLRPELPLVLRW